MASKLRTEGGRSGEHQRHDFDMWGTEHHRATAVPFDPVAAKAAKVESHALIRFNQDVLISFDKIHNRCIIV